MFVKEIYDILSDYLKERYAPGLEVQLVQGDSDLRLLRLRNVGGVTLRDLSISAEDTPIAEFYAVGAKTGNAYRWTAPNGRQIYLRPGRTVWARCNPEQAESLKNDGELVGTLTNGLGSVFKLKISLTNSKLCSDEKVLFMLEKFGGARERPA